MKISRPPSRITRAAARAPRNAPVRFTSRISRQTDGSVSSGPADDRRDPRVADPDVDAAPFGHGGVGDRVVELRVGHVAAEHERRPGKLLGDRLEVGLRPRHQRHPGAALRERVREQPAEPPAGAGDHHPLPGHVRRHRRRTRGCRSARASPLPSRVCTDQYNTRSMFSDADLLEMHRRMLVIRGFEERVAALYRDGEVPGFVHLSIGQEASAVGACWPLGPADVITSTHRGHGHCLAKGLDPLGMFAELMGKDAGTNRGRGGSMHIADPTIGIFGANGIVGAGLPIAVGRRDRGAAAARRQRRGRVLRRRRGGARHLPRSGQPRRGVAAAGDLLLREQRLRRVLARVDPARGAARAARRRLRRRLRRGRRQRRRGDRGRDARRWSRRRAPDAVPSSSRRPPTAGTVTTKATRERYRSPDEVREWEARDPLLVSARRLRSAGVTDDALEAHAVVGRARARRRRRGGPAAARPRRPRR